MKRTQALPTYNGAPQRVCTYRLRGLCSNIDDRQLCHSARTASATSLLYPVTEKTAPSEGQACSGEGSDALRTQLGG